MQFTRSTAFRYGLTNPHDPRESLDAAARYVRDLQTRFGPRVDLILAAYNAGEGTVEAFRDGRTLVLPNHKIINPHAQRTGGIPPYTETRQYVTRGEIIYRTLTRPAVSQPATSVDRSLQNNKAGDTSLVNTGRRDTVYPSEAAKPSSPEQTIKPRKSSRNNSIYVQ